MYLFSKRGWTCKILRHTSIWLDTPEKVSTASVSLLERAAALGSAEACSDLFLCYLLGLCGVEKDSAKARSLLIRAAKGGLAQARHNLATLEYESGQIDAAIRHLKISTAAGYKLSLESMEELRDEGHISEEEYNRAVADVVAAQKEEHTEERAAARKQRDINPALQ